MNYKVLYRKYRPDSFSSLIGQNSTKEILKNSIKEKKIAHAFLFAGPRGTGKTSTARIFAKAINCLNPQDGMSCDKCENCQSFSTSPDIIEIDAASNNGVNEIRELINNVKIMPTSLQYKVYIIDEVHMLSDSAFNALLLTLEEPPEHVIFILATTNLESVPITILSRCQKFDFKRINKNDIYDRLKFICEEEKIDYEEPALNEIATLADGGLRDALSILDQLSKTKDKITLDLVISDVGSISNKKIEELITSIDQNDLESIENIINEFRNNNLNYKVIIKKIIEQLSKNAIDYLKNGPKNHLSYDDYKHIVLELNDLINKININVDPYMLIELILLDYIEKNNDKLEKNSQKIVEQNKKEDCSQELSSSDSNVKKIDENIEKKPEKIIKKLSNIDKLIEIRINNCFVNASKDYLNKVKEMWKNYEESALPKIKGLIADTLPVISSDTYIILETTIRHQDRELNQEIDVIETNFNEINNTSYKMIFIDTEKWNEEKQKYINNLQTGYKYQYIEEKIIETTTEESTNESIEDLASSIFGLDKIEIK